ncbi:MAG: polyphosphate kinase 1 [Oscillospiraceae bacterium]|nr:polyphosphate kinase 1 [Oscillospiraceae bacterium]
MDEREERLEETEEIEEINSPEAEETEPPESAAPEPEAPEIPAVTLEGEEYQCFQDRELSWLQFNLRVLETAADRSVPLLERLKFLGIYRSNMEEFFMVRVGSLTHRSVLLPNERDEKTGWTAAQQLREILAEVTRQQNTVLKTYRNLLQDLKAAGIDVIDFRKVNKMDELLARKFFSEIRPLLSPRVVDAEHPFPFIGNGEHWVAVALKKSDKNDDIRLGLVPVFRVPPYRVVEVEGQQKVILTAEMVRYFAQLLFKKQEVREAVLLQVTRNADVFIETSLNSADDDFRSSMEKMLRKRKRQQPVRLQISGKPSARLKSMLIKALKVPEANVFTRSLPCDLSFGSGVRKSPGMKYDERRPQRNVKLQKGEYFRYLEKKDILLSFPFQSMNAFVDMLYEAADDPEVVSICITLYRLSASSKVAAALAYAADRGKSVLCLLELRARFDEQNNIDYSEVLEDAGCQVIYGLPEMKVHSKLCLITRHRGESVDYITQVGTGNYNETTSEQYTDLSVITADRTVGEDAAQIFESLALGQPPSFTRALWAAPNHYRSRVLRMIGEEKNKGAAGRIAIKVNSLNDIDVMRALIEASQAGVKVELFIRGICCLKPGVTGYTDNITVRSVVGRHLEHSRIFAFGEGEEQRIFVGSGDLLNRNTRRRVEVFIECTAPEVRGDVLTILQMLREDRERCWIMRSDGTYSREEIVPGTASQDRLYTYFGTRIVERLPEEAPEAPAREKAGQPGLFRRIMDFFRRSGNQ